MLRTFDRYVIRETIPPFFLSLLIFTFLLEIPPVMKELETLVAKGVTWSAAGRIILTLIPQGLGLTIPMSLLTGLLIALGRMSSDREAVALLACGVSPYRLLRPVLAMALVAVGATAYVMIKAIPDANQTFRQITFELIAKKVEGDIHPRVFFEDFPGWVLYASDEPAAGGGWKNVLVANTSKPQAAEIFLAARGRLVLERAERRVDLVLSDGTRYKSENSKPGESEVYRFPADLTLALNPDDVFRRVEVARGVSEKSIAELQGDMAAKIKAGISPHPEIIWMEQKFSIPVAAVVFAIIGVALGLTVARDGKLAGFVIGVAVIFAYYAVMFLAESYTKGLYSDPDIARHGPYWPAHLARWVPNLVLGLFGIGALIWRARFAERRLPITIPLGLPHLPSRWTAAAQPSTPAGPAVSATPARRRVVVVVRFPRLRVPGVGILDRYISRLYLRVVGLSFLALLGLFYISTFIDASDKLFKNTATSADVMQLLAFRTPQFVYFVIPIAALLSVLVTFGALSRTSELTVIKACGVSLYRTALPVLVLSLFWSAALFALDQEILARANRRAGAFDDRIRGRPPRTFNPLNRHWMIARDGSIYHYGYFDPDQDVLTSLTIYRLAPAGWRMASQTYAAAAQYRNGAWTGRKGSQLDLSVTPARGRTFTETPLALEPPDYFQTEATDVDNMTAAQLKRYVEEVAPTGVNVVSPRVELQRKLAFPFVTFVMTLLAVPFGVSTGKRGALYGIGLGIVIALSYWFISSVFIALGRAGLLSPILAAWTPNIIVVACAVYLLLTTKT